MFCFLVHKEFELSLLTPAAEETKSVTADAFLLPVYLRVLFKDQEPTEEVVLAVMIWSRLSITPRYILLRFLDTDAKGKVLKE